MHFRHFAATGLVLLASACALHAHGFKVSLTGDQLILTTDDVPVLQNDLFRHSLNTTPDPDSFTTNHGGFAKNTVPSDPFSPTDTFRFDVVTPLLFSNGGAATPARANVEMTGVTGLNSVNFDGSSVLGAPGYALPATSSHAIQWVLDFDSFLPADQGVYGFGYKISGYKNGDVNQPFDPVIAYLDYHTPGFTASPNLALAQSAVYTAATSAAAASAPEPASLATMTFVFGLAGLGYVWRRRRGRAHTSHGDNCPRGGAGKAKHFS